MVFGVYCTLPSGVPHASVSMLTSEWANGLCLSQGDVSRRKIHIVMLAYFLCKHEFRRLVNRTIFSLPALALDRLCRLQRWVHGGAGLRLSGVFYRTRRRCGACRCARRGSPVSCGCRGHLHGVRRGREQRKQDCWPPDSLHTAPLCEDCCCGLADRDTGEDASRLAPRLGCGVEVDVRWE